MFEVVSWPLGRTIRPQSWQWQRPRASGQPSILSGADVVAAAPQPRSPAPGSSCIRTQPPVRRPPGVATAAGAFSVGNHSPGRSRKSTSANQGEVVLDTNVRPCGTGNTTTSSWRKTASTAERPRPRSRRCDLVRSAPGVASSSEASGLRVMLRARRVAPSRWRRRCGDCSRASRAVRWPAARALSTTGSRSRGRRSQAQSGHQSCQQQRLAQLADWGLFWLNHAGSTVGPAVVVLEARFGPTGAPPRRRGKPRRSCSTSSFWRGPLQRPLGDPMGPGERLQPGRFVPFAVVEQRRGSELRGLASSSARCGGRARRRRRRRRRTRRTPSAPSRSARRSPGRPCRAARSPRSGAARPGAAAPSSPSAARPAAGRRRRRPR